MISGEPAVEQIRARARCWHCLVFEQGSYTDECWNAHGSLGTFSWHPCPTIVVTLLAANAMPRPCCRPPTTTTQHIATGEPAHAAAPLCAAAASRSVPNVDDTMYRISANNVQCIHAPHSPPGHDQCAVPNVVISVCCVPASCRWDEGGRQAAHHAASQIAPTGRVVLAGEDTAKTVEGVA